MQVSGQCSSGERARRFPKSLPGASSAQLTVLIRDYSLASDLLGMDRLTTAWDTPAIT